jgi:hypothetical protein
VLAQLDYVSGTRLNSYVLERRRALNAVVRGKNVELRKNLARSAPDHLNAEAWTRLIGQ